MSGLEAVGVIANILQLIEYGLKATNRINEYRRVTTELPETLQHVRRRLGPLKNALQNLERGINSGAVDKEARDDLWGVIQGCEMRMGELADIIKKCVPGPNASRAQRTMKALGSMRYDKKIEKLDVELGSYFDRLAAHTTISQAYGKAAGTSRFTTGRYAFTLD